MTKREWIAKQGFRLVGPPPPKGAPKIEQLRFVRRCYKRMLPIYVPAVIVLVLSRPPAWIWAPVALGAAIWLQGLFPITARIKREAHARPPHQQ